MSRIGVAAAIVAMVLASGTAAAQRQYLYVWTAGVDGQGDGSDKLVTVDAARKSDRYGRVVYTLSVGGRGALAGFAMSTDGRILRAARASDGKVFEFDVGADPSRPRLLRATAGATAGEVTHEARDERRLFVAGAGARDGPDAAHFVRAFNRDGEPPSLVFELDFRAPRLGLPLAVVLLSR